MSFASVNAPIAKNRLLHWLLNTPIARILWKHPRCKSKMPLPETQDSLRESGETKGVQSFEWKNLHATSIIYCPVWPDFDRSWLEKSTYYEDSISSISAWISDALENSVFLWRVSESRSCSGSQQKESSLLDNLCSGCFSRHPWGEAVKPSISALVICSNLSLLLHQPWRESYRNCNQVHLLQSSHRYLGHDILETYFVRSNW